MTEPTGAPSPWATPHDGAARGNAAAVWSCVLAVPFALLGLVLGVVGLVTARRRDGEGRTAAVVGTVVSGAVLVVGTVVGVVLAVSLLVAAGTGAAAGGGDGDSRGTDGTVDAVTADEQAFLDGLYEDTWSAHDDDDLLTMGHGVCDALEGGDGFAAADGDLLDSWPEVTVDEAFDVEWEATHELCGQWAQGYEDWDGSSSGAGADVDVAWTA